MNAIRVAISGVLALIIYFSLMDVLDPLITNFIAGSTNEILNTFVYIMPFFILMGICIASLEMALPSNNSVGRY